MTSRREPAPCTAVVGLLLFWAFLRAALVLQLIAIVIENNAPAAVGVALVWTGAMPWPR